MSTEAEHPVIRGLKWILETRKQPNGRGMSMRALSLAAGLTPGHVEQIVNKRQSADVEVSTLDALARAGNVRLDWLRTGKGDPGVYEGGPGGNADSTPQPPVTAPPSTGPRAKQPKGGEDEERFYFTDEVEALALRLVRRKGAPEYTHQELKAAKIFLQDAVHSLSKGVTRLDLLASAAEAARELTATGVTPTANGIYAVLWSKNIPKYAQPTSEEESFMEQLRREAREANEADGTHVPRKTVDTTPRTAPSRK